MIGMQENMVHIQAIEYFVKMIFQMHWGHNFPSLYRLDFLHYLKASLPEKLMQIQANPIHRQCIHRQEFVFVQFASVIFSFV